MPMPRAWPKMRGVSHEGLKTRSSSGLHHRAGTLGARVPAQKLLGRQLTDLDAALEDPHEHARTDGGRRAA
jgi:hypothetical protein